MNDDAIAALRYIIETEQDDFVDCISTGAIPEISEEDCEEIYDLERDSEEFAKIIANACNTGDMHIFARAYRGLNGVKA
jgi:hypothetical protein